jgi:hypothetical protein
MMTFDFLAQNVTKVIDSSSDSLRIVLPAMSQHASGSCNAYDSEGIPADGTIEYPPKCGVLKNDECICNGWLSFLKSSMLKTTQGERAWKRANAISIHAYYPYAHYVKLKILSFLNVFKDDVANGKMISLTEVAYVNKKGAQSTKEDYLKAAAEFARDLLHRDTSMPDAPCPTLFPLPSFVYAGQLPGLLQDTSFKFNDNNLRWSKHGLALVSWFALDTFKSFTTGCNLVEAPEDIHSSPLDKNGDGTFTKNVLFDGIFGI